MSYKTFNENMEAYRILIWNASGDTSINARLQLYGYTVEKLDAGKTLWQVTDNLGKLQAKEKNEQTDATDLFNESLEIAEYKLKRAKKLARIAFENDNAAWKQLNLNTLNISRFEDWLNDSEKFYLNLLSNQTWVTAMANYGYTSEILTASQQETVALKELQESQHREIGDAQQATKAKWESFKQLKNYCNHLKQIAIIEFEDDPQLLEKLGILARS